MFPSSPTGNSPRLATKAMLCQIRTRHSAVIEACPESPHLSFARWLPSLSNKSGGFQEPLAERHVLCCVYFSPLPTPPLIYAMIRDQLMNWEIKQWTRPDVSSASDRWLVRNVNYTYPWHFYIYILLEKKKQMNFLFIMNIRGKRRRRHQ